MEERIENQGAGRPNASRHFFFPCWVCVRTQAGFLFATRADCFEVLFDVLFPCLTLKGQQITGLVACFCMPPTPRTADLEWF